MGLDLTEHSPAVQQKIVYAGVAATSYAQAADLLSHLAELPVSTKQVERLTRAVGTQRVGQRDEAVAAFQALPLTQKFDAPLGVTPPDLVAVLVDGGRVQIRERDPSPAVSAPVSAEPAVLPDAEAFEEDGTTKGFWREDKVGLLVHLDSAVSADDPCAALPAGFVDALRIPKLARELGKVAARQEGEPDEAGPAESVSPAEQVLHQEASYEPPEVKHRQVLASCQKWSRFALIVAQAAWAAGFQKAKRKAFVADGAANNWRLHRRFFSSFVPILDFIHALSYVFAAALAGRSFEAGWACYQRWISWVWKGEVAKVIEELQQRQQEVGLPQPGESETSVASVVTRSLGYLSNHQDKMKYHEYRQQGLPITSSLMESVVKQMNYRVKGTEKFWCGEGAEGIVQLRADHLSDDHPLDEFWRQRQAAATGQRCYRRAG